MCAISGIVSFAGPVNPMPLAAMNYIQRHRGPDGEATWHDQHAALGFRRLAIVDVDHGTQPTSNEDGTVWAVFNGEIYNHEQLRTELALQGHQFRSMSDAEVIPHLYEELGPQFVDRLDGDFAIAVWDQRTRSLHLMRDPVGVKPLFYFSSQDTVVFASEAKGIFASGLHSPSMDPQGLSDCLFYGHTIAPTTFWRGVREVEPGTSLTFDGADPKEHRYFRPFMAGIGESLVSGQQAVFDFRTALTSAVAKRLPGEVEAGVALSGGLDSSAIAAVAARLCDEPLRTVSVRLDGAVHDETPMSRLVAHSLGVPNSEVGVDGQRACDLIRTSMWHFESPFWYGAVATPLLAMAQHARELGMKVMMSGDGSDELLAGYDFYRLMRADKVLDRRGARWIRPHVWKQAVKWVGAPTGFDRHVTAVGTRLRQQEDIYGEVPAWIYLWSALSDATTGLIGDLPSPSRLPAPPGHDQLRRQLSHEFSTRVPHWVLPISDRLGMASSVEFRVPFMDRGVMDTASRLAPEMLLRRGTEKYVLKQATADILPAATTKQRKKPFMTPVGDWYLRGPGTDMAGSYLSQNNVRQFGIFDPAATESLWRLADNARGTWQGVAAEFGCMAVMTTHMVLEQFQTESINAATALAR